MNIKSILTKCTLFVGLLLAYNIAGMAQQGGVLENDNNFQSYGEEKEQSLSPYPSLESKKSKRKRYRNQQGEQKQKRRKKRKQGNAQNPVGQNNSPDIISINLDGLYSVQLDEVEVKGKRNAPISFKVREDIKYYYNQALLKVAGKDFESAIKYLNKCIAKDKYNKELLQLRANAYNETSRFKKSLKDYENVIKIDPQDPQIHYNRATTLLKMGKFKDAVNAFTQALLLKPDYVYAYQGRATAKTYVKDFAGSVEDYNRVLDQDAFFVPAFKGRGVSKSLLGRYDEAISDFTYIIDVQPTDGMAYYYRGLAYVGNNEMYKGCADFDKAYQLNIPQAYTEIKESCR